MSNVTLPGTTGVRNRILGHASRLEYSWKRGEVSTSAPVCIEIHPTNRCNLKCVFCSYNDIRQGEYLPVPAFRDLVTDLINCTPTVKSVILSGGGEPSVHPYFSEAVHRLVDAGIEVGVITNGVLLTEKIKQAYLKCSWIRISIDVPWEETYVRLMSPHKPENFKQVIKNCKILSDERRRLNQDWPTIGLAYIMTKDSQSDEAFFKCIDIGVESKADYIMYRALLDLESEQITRPLSELRELLPKLEKYANNVGMPHQFEHFLNEFNQNSQKHVPTHLKECPIVQDGIYAYVAATGDVVPCYAIYKELMDDEWKYGNIKDMSFNEIWNSKLREEVIKRINASACPFCHFQVQNKILSEIDEKYAVNVEKEIQMEDIHWKFL
ncbi:MULTISPECIES: radical SAM protein [Bacillus]|uniref:radical SAM protein n=1 Tax=Bacillus TaxID=1386 RepID=UPI000D94826D|nr:MULTISPECIES: radical SAM protein [Bacillus]MDA1656356.1 radical SAM protein [Bacillus cereus group sp. TH150LC]PYE91522.1 radical SAM protein with 4Fe4S-binding SPASM domain [Bacillus sp. 196mf]